MAELLEVSTEPVKTAQTVAPGTEPSGWMPLPDEQRNAAPESVKALLEAKKWSTAEQIATGYMDLEKVLGKGDHIFKPESPDDADGWKKYYQQLGVPEVGEYEFEADEVVPFDDNVMSSFREFANKIHLNKEQASGVVQFQRDVIKAAMEADTQANEQAETQASADMEVVRQALVTKAGGEVAYQSMMVDARQTADNLGIYPTLERLGLASNPEVIGMLTTIAEKVTEGVLAPGTTEVPTKDPLVEMEEIKKSEAFLGRFHPQHKETMDRFMQLNMQIANSGKGPQRPTGG